MLNDGANNLLFINLKYLSIDSFSNFVLYNIKCHIRGDLSMVSYLTLNLTKPILFSTCQYFAEL